MTHVLLSDRYKDAEQILRQKGRKRPFEKLKRQFKLAETADLDAVSARCKVNKGVLKLTVSKRTEAVAVHQGHLCGLRATQNTLCTGRQHDIGYISLYGLYVLMGCVYNILVSTILIYQALRFQDMHCTVCCTVQNFATG